MREEEGVTSLKPRAGREFLFSYMPWRLGAVKKLELRRSHIKLSVYFKEGFHRDESQRLIEKVDGQET